MVTPEDAGDTNPVTEEASEAVEKSASAVESESKTAEVSTVVEAGEVVAAKPEEPKVMFLTSDILG